MAKHRATTVSPVKKIVFTSVILPIGIAQGFTQGLVEAFKDGYQSKKFEYSPDGEVTAIHHLTHQD